VSGQAVNKRGCNFTVMILFFRSGAHRRVPQLVPQKRALAGCCGVPLSAPDPPAGAPKKLLEQFYEQCLLGRASGSLQGVVRKQRGEIIARDLQAYGGKGPSCSGGTFFVGVGPELGHGDEVGLDTLQLAQGIGARPHRCGSSLATPDSRAVIAGIAFAARSEPAINSEIGGTAGL